MQKKLVSFVLQHNCPATNNFFDLWLLQTIWKPSLITLGSHFLKTINNDIIYFNYQIEIDIEPTDKVNIKVQLVASGTGFL